MKLYSLKNTPFEPVSHDPGLMKHVLVGEGILPHIKHISHIVLKPGSTASNHEHPDATEVFYCIRGDVRFSVNDKSINLSRGRCLIVEPCETHGIEAAITETEILYFFISD